MTVFEFVDGPKMLAFVFDDVVRDVQYTIYSCMYMYVQVLLMAGQPPGIKYRLFLGDFIRTSTCT